MLNLDTHVVIHLLSGTLQDEEVRLMEGQQVGISCIVLWELAKLKQLGRIAFGPDEPRIRDFLSQTTIWTIDTAVAMRSTQLDFSSDPADELIAATSIVHRVPLLTRDARIRTSKLVPLAIG